MNELDIDHVKIAAAKFSAVRLAFNLCTFHDGILEREVSDKQQQLIKRCAEQLDELIHFRNTTEDLADLREVIRIEIEQILRYSEYFKIYDQVLEVTKYRLGGDFTLSGKTDEQIAAMVMAYLKSSADMASFNAKVQNVAGLLPLRLTKQKFFSMLEESFGIYKGGNASAYKDFVALILSAVEFPQKAVIEFQGIEETLERLKSLDFKSLTKEECDYHRGTIKISDQVLSGATDIYIALAEIINDIYVLSLSNKLNDISNDSSIKAAMCIFENVISHIKTSDHLPVEEDVLSSLQSLENKQEEFFEQYQRYDIEQEDESTVIINRLLSSSVFAKLDTVNDSSIIDNAAFTKITNEFFEKLKDIWSNLQKPVMRLQMAHILSAVPVNYGNYYELQEFISGAIAGCSDLYEKEFCKKNLIDLLR